MEDNKQVIIPYSEYQEMQAKIAEADMRIKAEVAKQTEEAIKQKDEEFKKVIGYTLQEAREYMSCKRTYKPIIDYLEYVNDKWHDEISKIKEYTIRVENANMSLEKQAHAAIEKAKRLEEENKELKNRLKRKWWQIWKKRSK